MKEIWKAVHEFEGYYEISSHGRIRSLARVIMRRGGRAKSVGACVLRPLLKKSGYLHVVLLKGGSRRYFAIHTLVTRAFLGVRPGGHECCHYDGNKQNNHLSNLRYGTKSDNALDKRRHGTDHAGARNPVAKISDDDVRKIRGLRGKMHQHEIAEQFGLKQANISAIQLRKAWRHVA